MALPFRRRILYALIALGTVPAAIAVIGWALTVRSPASPAETTRQAVAEVAATGRELVQTIDSTRLTPKEREVLGLLAHNLSNKEIGLALQVGEETIKWHLKNLFAKLDAGSRKQVVRRARILGLLEAGD